MTVLMDFLSLHAAHAHWFIFFGALLAGFNLPISIDVLVIAAAIFSAKFIPEHTSLLYSFLLTGCIVSAWVSYILGRTIGLKLSRWKWFKAILSQQKVDKLSSFYKKYGLWAFVVGRFIPFGVRNCLFMSSGLSKMPFLRFACLDFFACLIWVSSSFYLFYHVGQNFDVIWYYVKTFNLFLFLIFAVAVISIIWYKRKKSLRIGKADRH